MNYSKQYLGRRAAYHAYKKTKEGEKRSRLIRPDAVHDPDPQEWEARLLGDTD